MKPQPQETQTVRPTEVALGLAVGAGATLIPDALASASAGGQLLIWPCGEAGGAAGISVRL